MLAAVLQDERIAKCSSDEPLRQALRYAMIIVGLRADNFPQEEEKRVLLQFIAQNYGGHTPSEIKLAFDMAVTGKLNLDKKEVICYENFSVLYFSQVMNAYREWSRQAYAHIRAKEELPALPPSHVSNDEFIDAVYVAWKAGGENFKLIPELAYRVLEPKLNLTRERKREIFNRINGQFVGPVEFIQELSKLMAVHEYFLTLDK